MAPPVPTAPSSHKPDPQYRRQDHVIFAMLVLPVFAITFITIALIVTFGTR